MDDKIKKKAQMMIWVILSILLIITIILFFLVERGPIRLTSKQTLNPKNMIELCVKESVEEGIGIMMPNGGFIEPKNYKLFNNIKVEYLCDNRGYYNPCINQHPAILNEMKRELKDYITPKVEECFSKAEMELERRNNEVSMDKMNLDVDFAPGKIYIYISRNFTISRGEGVSSFSNFNIIKDEPIYNLAMVAIEIANQEAKYCYFEYAGYMVLYPSVDIKKISMSESTKIYTIKDKKTGKEMNIAIRSCAMPSGI